MYCFAQLVPINYRRNRRGALCARRRATCGCWRASGSEGGNGASPPEAVGEEYDLLDTAMESAAPIRTRLRELDEKRRAQQKRTEQRVEEMSAQLKRLMEKVEKEIGASAGGKKVGTGPQASRKAEKGKTPAAPIASKEGEKTGVSRKNDENSDEESSSGEPYMDPTMFGFDSTAGWQVLANSDILPETEPGSDVQFRIKCDMNGCSIIESSADAPPGPGVRQKYVLSGKGFRVGYDPESPKSFCGMAGNEEWLLALSYDEVRHFKRLCLSLRKKMDRILSGEESVPGKKPSLRRSGDGMFNERVGRTGSDCSVEMESKLVWVQAFGQPEPGAYGIRAIFMEGRQSEGYWSPPVVPNMLAAVAKLRVE